MAEGFAAYAAYLGLRPQSASRLTPAEIMDLLDGMRLRWRRHTRLAAWFLQELQDFIARGVAHGIASQFSKDVRLPRSETLLDLLRRAPDYTVPEEEPEEEKPKPSKAEESPFWPSEEDEGGLMDG
jgi:hypothetical protein